MLKKVLSIVAAVLVLIIFIAALYVNRIATKALPDYSKNLKLEGLKEEVHIYRDDYAVPHIYASNEEDLYFATGYVLAQDRMWQMDLLRRVTLGRLSEMFGADLVEVDQLMRALKMTEKSKKILKNATPELLSALDQFAAGVNLYIEENSDKLPPEFTILGYKPEKWEPYQSVNLIGYMAWDLTMPYTVETLLSKIKPVVSDKQYVELLPDVDKQSSTAFPASPAKISESDVTKDLLAKMGKLEKWGLQSFEGSNNWAVGGAKTKSGAPIFCNDMHLGLNAPGLWYQIHQHVEGKVNVTGVLLPGQPFIIAGHNEDIAWGMTNVMVDDMDFYEERMNESGDKYEYLGEWHDLESVVENIGLKGGGDTTITNYYTQRGPIISSLKGIDDRWISMTWTGFGFSDELRSVYLLNRASNWDEFRDAVSTFRSVSQNVNYADRFGNIGLHNCAGIPIRPDGMNGIDIYPGWTDEFNWKGIVPFEEQLYSFNPTENYVSSANNKTAVNDYPYPVSTWFALHYRIDRIRELLDSNDNITVEKMKTIQTDIESIFVREVKPLIISNLIERNDLSDLEKNMLNKLLAWDNQVRKESAEAAVFELFYVNFLKNMMEDELGAELYVEYTKSSYLARYFMNNLVINEDSYYVDDITTEAVENLSDIMLKSYRQALAELKEKSSSNPDDWQWGDIHKLILKHPLGSVKILDRLFHFNTEPIPAQGSFHTVAPCAYKLSDPFDVNHGASQRHIYTPDNWDNSFTVIPSGNSGIPASDHYCDQTKLYMDFKYHHDYFSLEKIKSAAKYEQKLIPVIN